jgi:cell surface protein SprA
LYPDAYEAWKYSVKHSLAHFGRPLTYASSFNASYKVPLDKIPVFDWLAVDGSYASNYGWNRGTELEDGSSLGHTANTQRTINVNARVNMETLYKKWKFLDDANKRFSGTNKKTTTTSRTSTPSTPANNAANARNANGNGAQASDDKSKSTNKNFSKEVTLNDSTYTDVPHGQKSKRLIVKATTKEGKTYKLKYKKVDENTIRVKNRDTIPVKITVTAKEPLDDRGWYKALQTVARGLMMLRNINVTYRNTYAMTLPGLRNEIGDAFGQKSVNGALSPGLDFAFGAVGDGFVNKAVRNGWLMDNDSNITTPVSTNATEDLQVRATLEPLRDLKIDLSASRNVNKSKSVQFMYAGMPTTQSGSFNMTIISATTAFSGSGTITDNYNSKPFNEFLRNLDVVKTRLEQKYEGVTYPVGTGAAFEGKPYNAENGSVDKYSPDVMIPAFLAAYTGSNSSSCNLDIFPSILRMLPNWSFTYSGLSKLGWFSRHFKSFNINHTYKSVYSVGAYNSYTNYMGIMNDMGFILDVTSGNPIPSSMYNISTVSINESFSPLIGIDMTFNNSMTAKLEYKKNRMLNLSLTSVALTENYSNDIVVGMSYKVKDLNLFGAKRIQSGEPKKKKNSKKAADENAAKTTTTTNTRVGGVSHDLNLTFNFTYRMQNALNRNIQTQVATATNGSTAYKISMTADYTFSRMLTISGYLDWQKNVPLVSATSYPTTTADFGISCKFMLTR